MNLKQSIIGSSFAFLLATSCCWLPWLIIAIGGSIGIADFSETLDKFSVVFLLIGLGSLGWGTFHFYKRKNINESTPKSINFHKMNYFG